MESPRNHISPRFTNEPWANEHGRLLVLRRSSAGVVAAPSGPNHWGHERGLYPPAIEEALGRFENAVAPVYRFLLEGKILSPEQRHLWSHWLLCQFARTPSHLLDLAGIPEQVVSHLKLDPIDNLFESTDEAIAAALSNIIDFTLNRELVPFIVLRDWVVYRAPSGTSFVKGDNSVVLQGALIDEGTRIVYPLSPELCFEAGILGPFPPRQLQVEHQITPGQVRETNQLLAHYADREVICRADAATPELLSDVAEHLGSHGPLLQIGSGPEWPK
ncbi:MAG TPA: DUF4238 domain-containing protein [Thermoanaerobaculia bacterium]|nr:DUF4238 domain-containing protein [Thermoanaerobaculia bacterium]